MAITSYSELKSAIADELNRQDLTSVISTWISLAEANFNRTIRHRKMLCRSTAILDSQFTALPSDFLEAKNVQLQDAESLEFLTVELADMYRNRMYAGAGAPQFYTILGETLEVVPTPDSDRTIELTYYKKLTSLSDSVQTNWLLTSHPDLYFYASLQHSAPYLKDDERISLWSTIAQTLTDSVNLESDKAEKSGSVLRIRSPSLG
jgi:hypothetical protein